MTEQRKIALVSGASRGIGAATARELGRRGHHVIVNYHRSADAAAAVVSAIEAEGGTAQRTKADVCDPGQVAELVAGVRREHGRVDALVCNANTEQPPWEPFATLPWETFIGKVDRELAGSYFLTQEVLKIMKEQRGGRIVYLSSIAADHVGTSIAHSSAKAALNAFGKHIASDAGPYGINVNIVAPGAVRTDATSDVIDDAVSERLTGRSVLGRVLEPEDLANTIALLVDDAFRGVSGVVLQVDAGFDVLKPGLLKP
ncbi:SDR family oxidoreductase [Amycolatopsis nigrescens]|uniref:SDR family oxidoreductase n=1 Tax=Amycolatopsis nigrescens TaxID=381445 RepID=UPI0003809090|nr:SDR family oxidoreductase [Amycolatopsis nigrescens]